MMDLIETTPKMDLAIQDIEHLVEELHGFCRKVAFSRVWQSVSR